MLGSCVTRRAASLPTLARLFNSYTLSEGLLTPSTEFGSSASPGRTRSQRKTRGRGLSPFSNLFSAEEWPSPEELVSTPITGGTLLNPYDTPISRPIACSG